MEHLPIRYDGSKRFWLHHQHLDLLLHSTLKGKLTAATRPGYRNEVTADGGFTDIESNLDWTLSGTDIYRNVTHTYQRVRLGKQREQDTS